MTVNRLKKCITNTVITYYNYQVERNSHKAEIAGMTKLAISLRERDEYEDYDKLLLLVNNMSEHLYANRNDHLLCLLNIFKSIQKIIDNPAESIERQAESIKNFLENYFIAIIGLYTKDSDTKLSDKTTLNTLKAYTYGVSTGISSFGTTLETCILHPFNLNLHSCKDDIQYVAETISQDLLGIVTRNAKEQDLEKKQQHSSLIINLEQQLSEKVETIKQQEEEIAKLKKQVEQSGPVKISFADAFGAGTTLFEKPKETAVVTKPSDVSNEISL